MTSHQKETTGSEKKKTKTNTKIGENRSGEKRSCRWGKNREPGKLRKQAAIFFFTLQENKRWSYVKLVKQP